LGAEQTPSNNQTRKSTDKELTSKEEIAAAAAQEKAARIGT
jgi:hypothetical protein